MKDANDHATPSGTGATYFAISLFKGVEKTRPHPRRLSLAALAELLTSFQVLADKYQGRCWSPSLYAPGTRSRCNSGVVALSCLVFDLDGAMPAPERLAGTCWIGHATWSHTVLIPRWLSIATRYRPVDRHDH